MNISDEALIAAWTAFHAGEENMRMALEAAAPHLMAAAWDEGVEFCCKHGFSDSANPYRSAGAGE